MFSQEKRNKTARGYDIISGMKPQKVFRVIAALPLGSESGRKILNGVYRFLSEGYSWDIELLRRENEFARLFEPGGIDTSEFDGILVAYAESQELRIKQAEIDLPTVFVDYPDPVRSKISRHAFVSDDEMSIADTAVRHLLSTGLRASFGFVHARTPTEWSMRRGAAFKAKMKSRGFDASIFPGGDRQALAEWLSALPKPTAVLAAYDDRAMDVLEACRHAELAVPKDVAVLGIGNDEILCEAATPPLSSVVCEFAAQGYSAARELQALMLGGRQRKSVSFGAKDTAVRASTLGSSPSAAIATRAMRYIRENALRGISTKDVVSHLRTSERLAMLRFSEAYGKSMLEAIIDLRIAEAKRLLAKTKLSVAEIALRSGFHDATAFRAVFTRRLGKSPREFRHACP